MDVTHMSDMSAHSYHIIASSLIRITSLMCVHHANVTHTDVTHDAPVMRHSERHADVTHMSDVIRMSDDAMI